MRTQKIKLGLVAGASLFSLVGGVGSVALAHDGTDDSSHTSPTLTHTEGAENEQEAEAHLAAKQNACQAHQKVINATMQRIAARGQRHLAVFDKISTRVENFAETKAKKPSNYDALVSDVNAKKDAAQSALDKIKSDSVSFKCDGTDPKGVASSFKADLKSEIAALKDYKTALKNLIVGVKSANSAASASDNSSGGTD
jgi:hypothetical protein